MTRSYSAYGQLDALSNGAYVYWSAQAENDWQHVISESYPGNITGSHLDWPLTGQAETLGWTGATSDQLSYAYDSFGNLVSQSRSAPNANTETYVYDSLQRLMSTTRSGAGGGGVVSYSYTLSGNLATKSDFGGGATYAYAAINTPPTSAGTCGSHAVSAVGAYNYKCDMDGNIVGGSTLTAVFDGENRPKSMTRTPIAPMTQSGTMQWVYTPTGQIDVETSSEGTRYFGPQGYEQIGSGASATQKYEIGPVVVTRTNNANDILTVTLRDRLGSTMNAIEDGTSTARAYDAFGKARNGNFTDRANGTLNLTSAALPGTLQTIHGFTQHDHADDVALVHMNGRIFDPNLGRFLQVDPIIQSPANSQSLNPYSYVGNNPLSGTDPTGYATCAASETASTSECADVGVHTIVAADGSKTTLVVGNAGDNIAFSGNMNVGTFKDLSGGKLNLALNPSSGADNWIKNGPSGTNSKDASSINSLSSNDGCAGGISCYDVHRNETTGNVDSFQRTLSVDRDYGAINGITNELGRAMQLMSEHVSTRFGADDFVLAHDPTNGMMRDLFDTALDKAGLTTALSHAFGQVLASVDHPVSWLAHSRGGEIFAEGARDALNHGASDLSNNTVAFDSGANNRWATSGILTRGGIQLFGKGYYDANNDAVPNIVGLRGGPIDMLRSARDFPKLFGPDSPHTHPQPNE